MAGRGLGVFQDLWPTSQIFLNPLWGIVVSGQSYDHRGSFNCWICFQLLPGTEPFPEV